MQGFRRNAFRHIVIRRGNQSRYHCKGNTWNKNNKLMSAKKKIFGDVLKGDQYTYQSISHSFLAGTNHLGGMQTSHDFGAVILHRPMNWSNPRFFSWSLCWSAQIKLPLQSSSVSQSRTSHMVHGLLAVHARNETNKVHLWDFHPVATCTLSWLLWIWLYNVRGTTVAFCAVAEAMKHKTTIRIDDCILVFVAKLLKAYWFSLRSYWKLICAVLLWNLFYFLRM